jgi:hypothetical protein
MARNDRTSHGASAGRAASRPSRRSARCCPSGRSRCPHKRRGPSDSPRQRTRPIPARRPRPPDHFCGDRQLHATLLQVTDAVTRVALPHDDVGTPIALDASRQTRRRQKACALNGVFSRGAMVAPHRQAAVNAAACTPGIIAATAAACTGTASPARVVIVVVLANGRCRKNRCHGSSTTGASATLGWEHRGVQQLTAGIAGEGGGALTRCDAVPLLVHRENRHLQPIDRAAVSPITAVVDARPSSVRTSVLNI